MEQLFINQPQKYYVGKEKFLFMNQFKMDKTRL